MIINRGCAVFVECELVSLNYDYRLELPFACVSEHPAKKFHSHVHGQTVARPCIYRTTEGIEFALYEDCTFTIDNHISSTLSTRRSVGKDFAFNSFQEQYDYHLRHKL